MLLVIVIDFVGAIAGLEGTILPRLAEETFVLVSRTVILSILVSFGAVKTMANLFAGRLEVRLAASRCWWLAVWPAGARRSRHRLETITRE